MKLARHQHLRRAEHCLGVALYIVRRLGTRALFATHYHELTALEALYPTVQNCHMAVRETPEEIVFLRQVLPGGASKVTACMWRAWQGCRQVLTEAARVLMYLEKQGTTPWQTRLPRRTAREWPRQD